VTAFLFWLYSLTKIIEEKAADLRGKYQKLFISIFGSFIALPSGVYIGAFGSRLKVFLRASW
jgi:hypothetical protein